MKDIDTDVPLAPRAKKTPNDPTRTMPASAELGSFYAEGRALIDSRKTHLARVGLGPHEQTPAVAGTQEIPSQRKMLAMDAHDVGVDQPRLLTEQLPEGDATLYKPRRIPADAVNHEA